MAVKHMVTGETWITNKLEKNMEPANYITENQFNGDKHATNERHDQNGMADNKSLTAMRTMYKLVVVRWGLKCKSVCSMIRTKCSKLTTNRLTRRSQRDYENDVHRPLQFNSGNCLPNCNEARFLCFGCDAGL